MTQQLPVQHVQTSHTASSPESVSRLPYGMYRSSSSSGSFSSGSSGYKTSGKHPERTDGNIKAINPCNLHRLNSSESKKSLIPVATLSGPRNSCQKVQTESGGQHGQPTENYSMSCVSVNPKINWKNPVTRDTATTAGDNRHRGSPETTASGSGKRTRGSPCSERRKVKWKYPLTSSGSQKPGEQIGRDIHHAAGSSNMQSVIEAKGKGSEELVSDTVSATDCHRHQSATDKAVVGPDAFSL